ncbi:hypothetical protein LY78DRAFT_352529 [Colletotrichum sublineola]|nr:hypothetical protein LY78DRAFT_352529 [Colletotrichum sublineola]
MKLYERSQERLLSACLFSWIFSYSCTRTSGIAAAAAPAEAIQRTSRTFRSPPCPVMSADYNTLPAIIIPYNLLWTRSISTQNGHTSDGVETTSPPPPPKPPRPNGKVSMGTTCPLSEPAPTKKC